MGYAWCGGATAALAQAPAPAQPASAQSETGAAGKTGAAAADSKKAADQLDRLFGGLEVADRETDRETFDPLAVIEKVGREPAKLFEWVRDQTGWVPYRGALRGPAGVLMDRTGNSLDRSLLLAALLTSAGHQARLARAELPQDRARELLPNLLAAKPAPIPGATSQPEAFEQSLQQKAQELAKVAGLDPVALVEQFQRQTMASQRLAEDLTVRTTEQAQLLSNAVKGAAAPADAQASGVAALRDLWWVQVGRGDAWTDLDPTLPDAQPGKALAAAAETVPFNAQRPLESLAAKHKELAHQVTLSVVIERWSGGKLELLPALTHSFRPAEALGRPMFLRHAPLQWPSGLDLYKSPDPLTKLKEVALAQKSWLPTLAIGGETISQKSVDQAGKLDDAAKSDPSGAVGQRVGGLFGGAFGGDSGEEANGVLTAEWIEYTIAVPGAEPVKVRRELFDLIGPAARPAGPNASVPKPALTEGQRAVRALAMMSETEFLPAVCRFSPEFIEHTVASSVLANRKMLVGSLRAAAEGKPGPRQLAQPVPNGALYGLASMRFAQSPYADRLYVDRPNLISYHKQMSPSPEGATRQGRPGPPVVSRQGFDIVVNEVAVRPAGGAGAGGADAFAVRIAQGVLDTNAEALLSGLKGPTDGAAESLAAAAGRGETLACLRTDEDLAQAQKAHGLSPDAAARARLALAEGQWVVVAASPQGQPASGDQPPREAAWWKVDPKTGTTLGIGSRGWGQATTEQIIVQVLIGIETMMGCFIGQMGRVWVREVPGSDPAILVVACVVGGIATGGLAPVSMAGLVFSTLAGFVAGLTMS